MPQDDHNLFESEEFLLQIYREHFIYAEKPEVRFDFRNIARVRIYRRKPERKVSKITYRVRGQFSSFQIDGFGDSEMDQIAAILKKRAEEFSIPITDPDAT
jgi:hypothetical protein